VFFLLILFASDIVAAEVFNKVQLLFLPAGSADFFAAGLYVYTAYSLPAGSEYFFAAVLYVYTAYFILFILQYIYVYDCLGPLIRVNPGSIFRWGLIFIFGGLVNFF
jgi:hypothetical protein